LVNLLEIVLQQWRIHNMEIITYVIFALIIINIITEIRRS